MTSTTKQKKQLKVAEASPSYLVEHQEVRHSSESRNPALSSVGWRTAKLGEILPLKYGKARTEQFGHLRPQTATFGSNGAFGTFDRALTKTAAIIVGRKGAAGAVHYSHEPCWPIDTAFYTEGSEGVFLPFFRYLLESLQLVRLDRSTAIPSLSRDDYDSKIIRFPESLGEQRNIVTEIEKQFTRLEAGIVALRRAQANLKRYRAAVLKAACEGRLVPTEAELASNESRAYETGAQLLARILGERKQKWIGRGKYKDATATANANLPPLPQGWTWATVEQLAAPEPNSITDGPFGSNLKTEHYTASGPRVIRLQNIGDGIYVDEEAHISKPHFERLQKHRVFANDLVIAGFGENPPRSCIIPATFGPGIVKADCIRFKPHNEVAVKYLNAALNSEPVRKRTKKMVHGVGRPRLNLGEIRSIVLPLPPLPEQERIVMEVERLLSVVEEQEAMVSANLQRATRLRQSILRKAFTGS